MKKMLLLLVCLTTFAWLHADEVTFDFTAQNYSNQQAITSVNAGNDITIVFSEGSNPAKYYTSGTAVRTYAGGKTTITSTAGNITKIEFTFNGANAFKNGETVSVGTLSDNYTIWTGDAKSITFTNPSSGQVHFQKMVITYSAPTTVSEPTFTPGSGRVKEGTLVSIASSTEGAKIYYTTDGNTPTIESTEYTAPIAVNVAMTIKAIAVKDGLNNSEVAEASYEIIESLKDEENVTITFSEIYSNDFNLNGQTIKLNDYISISFSNGGSSTPPKYYKNGTAVRFYASNELTVNAIEGVVIKQIIFTTPAGQSWISSNTDGYSNAIWSGTANNVSFKQTSGTARFSAIAITYAPDVAPNQVATPTFSPAASNVAEGTEVSIDCETEGATIHYTTDGSDPDANSAEYTEPIAIDHAMTIKAIAVKEGMNNSDIAEAAYKIIVATPMFDPAPGAVKKGTEVTITCGTEGATLMYQVNGGELLEGESGVTVVINEATTIEVIASKDGYVDSEATAVYSIEGEVPMSYTAQFDFSDPTKLNPAQDYPSFEGMNPSGSVTRVLVAGVEFTNHYVVAEFVAPDNATATNTPQIMYNTDAENNKIAFVRAFKNSGLKITGLRQLQIEKIEITGTDLNNILYNGSVVNSSATTELVWERSAVSALAETSENDVVEFKISSSKAVSINAIKVTTLDITNGADDIIVDENAPVEYYNLQGVRVANPENGIYIRRQGSKVSKVLVK